MAKASRLHLECEPHFKNSRKYETPSTLSTKPQTRKDQPPQGGLCIILLVYILFTNLIQFTHVPDQRQSTRHIYYGTKQKTNQP
jgi:hypothetical protein